MKKTRMPRDSIRAANGIALRHVATVRTTPEERAEARRILVAQRQATRKTENEQYLLLPNVTAFLSTLADTEGADYDFKYGAVRGRRNDHWRITDFSLPPGLGSDGHTTASGRYQITIDTYRDVGVTAMGLTDFTHHSQDLMAVEILRQVHAIDDIVAGNMSDGVHKAAGRWESLPMGPGQANRPLHGRPSHQPYTPYPEVISTYQGYGGTLAGQ